MGPDDVFIELQRWARSMGIPLITVGWSEPGAGHPSDAHHYRTLVHNRHLDWVFETSMPKAIPLLLTRIAVEILEARENQFGMDALAHEMRNPLSVLAGHLELLEGEIGPHPRIVPMRRAMARMQRRLDWATHQTGPVMPAPFSVRVLWDGIIEDLEPEWRHRELNWVYHGESSIIESDPWRVEQILFNLAKNAIEASPDGATIRADMYQVCDDIVFRVSNTGEPLSDPQRHSLFQPQDSVKGMGHGVGLALSQRLAKTLGGKILYTPEVGGVSFTLIL